MKLNVNGDDLDVVVTEDLLEEKLRSLPGKGDSFLILSKTEMDYMQTAGSFQEGFILEYQGGSTDEHYTCANDPLTNDQVVQAFKDYLNENANWKSDLIWQKEESNAGGMNWPVILLVLLVVAGILYWLLSSAA